MMIHSKLSLLFDLKMQIIEIIFLNIIHRKMNILLAEKNALKNASDENLEKEPHLNPNSSSNKI